MKSEALICVTLLAFAVAFAGSKPGAEFAITEIPLFPRPISFSTADTNIFYGEHVMALNDRGDLLVEALSGIAVEDYLEVQSYRTFLWVGKSWVQLPCSALSYISAGLGFNQRGDILIVEVFNDIPFGRYTSSIWRHGTVTPLELPFDSAAARQFGRRGHLAGDFYVTEPYATNSDGQVYVAPVAHPFLFSDGRLVDLAQIGRGKPISVTMNHRGDAAVLVAPSNASSPVKLTLLSHEETTDAFPPTNWSGLNPWLIGNQMVVGGWANVTGERAWSRSTSFVFRNGRFIDLGRTNETVSSWGMNDRGDVVGGISDEETMGWPEGIKGFVFRGDERSYIHDLVPANSGWQLYFPTAINNRRQIAGFGKHHGKLAVYLLTPQRKPPGNESERPASHPKPLVQSAK